MGMKPTHLLLPIVCSLRARAFVLLSVLVLLLVSGGCAASRASRGAEPSKVASPEVEWVPLIAEAYHYYTAGNYLAAAGNDSAAIIQYRRALTYDPGSRQIRLALAYAYARSGRFEDAAIRAESIRPRDEEVLGFLADVYLRLRNFQRRLAIYEEWSRLDSTNVRVWQLLSQTYRSTNDTLKQIDALERLARLQPDPIVYEQLGFLCLDTGNSDSAEIWFKRATVADSSQKATRVMLGLAQIWSERENPDSAYFYYSRAVELNYYNTELRKRFFYFVLQQGRTNEAIEHARLILQLSPDEPDVLYRLGLLEYDAEQPDSAEVRFTQWVTQYGDDGLARYLLGRIALERGDTTTAEAQYMESILLSDTLVEAYVSLAYIYSQREQFDTAIAVYDRGLANVPDQPALLFGLAAALERHGDFDRSVSTFERLLSLDPDHAPALNYLGYMWADQGVRLGEALALIERAVELQPENGAYLDSYAWVLYRLGRTRDAEAKVRQALDYIQDDAIVYQHYGDILADLGRMDEAADKWRRALDLDPDNVELKEKLKR
jgi:tetratricopeptide (TPR) repeat protein